MNLREGSTTAATAVSTILCSVLVLTLAGCTKPTSEAVDLLQQPSENASQAVDTLTVNESVAGRPATASSLISGSPLAQLATDLDRVATSQSSAVQEMKAASAALAALKFERFPEVRPTAAAPLTNGGSASFGLSIEQLIWDRGRLKAQLGTAELKVAEAATRAWQDRNQTIFEGLRAYVNLTRYSARLEELEKLSGELEVIAELLSTRLEGGVADRGETLRMNVAAQEVQRRIVADMSDLRQARSELQRWVPEAANLAPIPDLGAARPSCSRSWPVGEAPDVSLARIALARAVASEREVRAQRFPKIVLGGGSSYVQGEWTEPSVSVRLDASDMLGFGRRSNISAAAASTQAAAASYRVQLDDTQADLERLDADHSSLLSNEAALRALIQENTATLELFKEQLDVGTIPFTEGIVLHREQTDTKIALIDTQADVLLNCLKSSQLRGLLAVFGGINGAF